MTFLASVPATVRQSVVDIRELGVVCDGRKRGQSGVIAAAFETAFAHRLKLVGGDWLFVEQTIPGRGIAVDFRQMLILTVPLDVASPNGTSKDVALPSPWWSEGKPGILTQDVLEEDGSLTRTGIVADVGRRDDQQYALEQSYVIIGDGSATLKRRGSCTRLRVLDDKSPGTRVYLGGGYGYLGAAAVGDTEGPLIESDARCDMLGGYLDASPNGTPDGVTLRLNLRSCGASYAEADNLGASPLVEIQHQDRLVPADDRFDIRVRTGKVTHIDEKNHRGGAKGRHMKAAKQNGAPVDTLIWDAELKDGGSGLLAEINAGFLSGQVHAARWKKPKDREPVTIAPGCNQTGFRLAIDRPSVLT